MSVFFVRLSPATRRSRKAGSVCTYTVLHQCSSNDFEAFHSSQVSSFKLCTVCLAHNVSPTLRMAFLLPFFLSLSSPDPDFVLFLRPQLSLSLSLSLSSLSSLSMSAGWWSLEGMGIKSSHHYVCV